MEMISKIILPFIPVHCVLCADREDARGVVLLVVRSIDGFMVGEKGGTGKVV